MVLSTAQTLRHYAIDLSRRCPGLPPVGKIYQGLLHCRSVFSSEKFDYSLICTGTDTEPCQIVDHLASWNEFFWLVNAALKEMPNGKLGVVYQLGYRPNAALQQQRLQACIVLHWLLKEHHCVETLELETTVIPLNHHLFCYALRLNTGLKRLRLMKYDLKGTVCEDVISAVATMVGLEILELVEFSLPAGASKLLGMFVKQTRSLRQLKLHVPRTTRGAVGDLVSGLKANSSLTALDLGDGWLKNGKGDATLAEYLAQNTTLKELVIDDQVSGGSYSAAALVSSLITNRCLEKFTFFAADWSACGRVVADVMAVNRTLRFLRVGGALIGSKVFFAVIEKNVGIVNLGFDPRSASDLEMIGQVIRERKELRRITIRSSDGVIVDDFRALLQAVADSQSLEEIRLKDIHELRLGDFNRVIREMGVEDKVKHNSYISEPLIRISTIDSGLRLDRKIYGPQEILEPGIVLSGLRQLVCVRGIVDLTLIMNQHIDIECATLLADFLSSSRALKDVHLAFFTEDATTRVLVQGLKSNRSISKLTLGQWSFSLRNAALFGSFLKGSKTLTDLTLLSPDSDMLLRDMACSLTNNDLLPYTRTTELRDSENSLYRVCDILNRNASMLHGAVKFVMGSRMKHHAEAFEQLYESESLLSLLKEHVPESDFDLKERIKESVLYLELNFMTLAGVVKERVVCNTIREGQRLQLDGIGLDNWLRVRSYLKVSDVVKRPVSRFSSGGAKKSRTSAKKLM